MPADFFPSPIFGGLYVIALIAFAWTCAWFDARTMRIPNRLTYSMAIAGLPVNLIRGGWLGALGGDGPMWVFDQRTPGLGIADGLLFSLAGFCTGFAVLFVMWILRTCGGGDVKLFAALGAWIGPMPVLHVLGVSLPILLVLVILKLAVGGKSNQASAGNSAADKSSATKTATRKSDKTSKKSGNDDQTEKSVLPQVRLAYSLPVAISLLIVLAWEFRVEIGFFS